MPPTRPQKSTFRARKPGALEEIARGVDALRAGAIIHILDADASVTSALAVETAGAPALRSFDASLAAPRLVLTHARARTLKIRLYTPGVVALPLSPPLEIEKLRATADPTIDLEEPLKGPFETLREALPAAWAGAVKLAKLAGLLPAMVVVAGKVGPTSAVSIATTTLAAYEGEVVRSLKLVTRARVPLTGAERTEIAAFRAGNGEPEHYAIMIGDPQPGRPVLVRLHSECFTGDLLGSLRCDCGAQLRGAVTAIVASGGGILLYLAQEGRGIGLINKLRAYRLQDQGFDTIEANERLGFERDERLYGIAARMLALLGFNSVRLMTNNPEKVTALRTAGIEVQGRVPHAFPSNVHNRDYLETKKRSGHLL
jgi:GTP cyclohydrolase II